MNAVRKTTLMWNFSNSKGKLSSDRLKRVCGSKRTLPRRQLEFIDVSKIDQPIHTSDEIKVGDWTIFKNVCNESNESEESENTANFILGNVLCFQYSGGKTYKQREYPSDFASTLQENNSKTIDALALWYEIDEFGIIRAFEKPRCIFVKIDNYIANLESYAISKKSVEQICISQEYLEPALKSLQNIIENNAMK